MSDEKVEWDIDANLPMYTRDFLKISGVDYVPKYKYAATRAVLADRERELLKLKGPCSTKTCPLHYAHSGPCECEGV